MMQTTQLWFTFINLQLKLYKRQWGTINAYKQGEINHLHRRTLEFLSDFPHSEFLLAQEEKMSQWIKLIIETDSGVVSFLSFFFFL